MILTQNSIPKDIEEQFVNTFALPKFRARACYELSSQVNRKRDNFFSKLAQTPRLIVKKNCIVEIPHLTKELEFSTIKSMLITYGAKEDISYVMSTIVEDFTQNLLPLDKGLETCLNQSMTIVLVCTEDLAFVQLERISGSPERYLLTNNRKRR